MPWLKIAGRYALYAAGAGVIALVLLFFYYVWNLPQPEKFTETPFIQSSKIYDKTGKVLLYDIFGEEKREIVPFEKISSNIKNAILVSEDERFYQHGGFDIQGIIRSLIVDLRGGSQGGSTITQQLVRSVYLTKQKKISRKIKEIVLSIQLESRYSKDQILDWYLNEVPFGENAYGVESASQTYFNKPASDVTLAQAAILASILPAPSHYSPYGAYKAELLEKKDALLEKMNRLGYITQQQLEEAKAEKLEFSEATNSIKAPDFVLYVKKYLDEKYGEDYLKEKGLRIYTTLDWDLQEHAEKVLKDSTSALASRRAYNAATVAINPKTGEILALVGSKDYFGEPYPKGCDEQAGNKCLFAPKYDVVTMGQRQPGSSFKPLVYATAFKRGFTPDTVVWDVKTEFNTYCSPDAQQVVDATGSKCYHPQNYDGNVRGKVSLRQSLAGSLNIPSVKTLYLAGIPESLETARDLGITTLTDTNNYGLSLVLGGGDVNLMEMVSAYGVFATEGDYTAPVSILKITDSEGNIIEENKVNSTKVLDTQVARQISNILSDNNARSFIFGPNSPLNIPGYDVAVKTGTTQNYVDGWTLGYAPSIAVGVWVGNNNNVPTYDSGVGLAAPIWHKIIEKVLEGQPKESFTAPDPITGRSAALMGTLPKEDIHTILHYVDRNNPLGPEPRYPEKDPQYSHWQAAITNWVNPQPILPPEPLPGDPIIPPDNQPPVDIFE